MALYDYFARRSEAKQPLTFASGLATGMSNPWYLAIGGRSTARKQQLSRCEKSVWLQLRECGDGAGVYFLT